MSKEVVIDKKTNIKNIQNKEECEVLTLKCRVNPKRLKEFINVKELTIDYLEKLGCNYNERNIGLLPFNDKIEKLIFKTFYTIGEDKTRGILKYYKFILPNLKSIEFPSYIYNYYEEYLEKITSLEEIIFNFNDDARTYLDGLMYTFSNDIKRIIIKYKDKEYTIEPKYKIGSIDDISYDEDDHEITLEFSDNYTESEIHININNGYIWEDNNWEIHSNNDTVYIPDYATNLNSYENSGIKKLSFNLNLLNHIDERDTIIYHCDSLKKIELRSNNEMSLMDKKEINICDYGNLLDIYIENYKLVLEYQDFKILIDNKGKITKLDNTKEFEEILDNYSLEELEVYASYLRLLKISNELSYQSAMSEISKTLSKKYPKFLK